MDYQETAIRAVVERLNLESLKAVATRPGIQSAYRIIVSYADGRAYDSASTIIYITNQPHAIQETRYSGFLKNKAIKREIDLVNYRRFVKTLQNIQFDSLHFPVSELLHAPTIWYIERATGQFSHAVLLNPHISEKPYVLLTNIIDGILPDAVREIRV